MCDLSTGCEVIPTSLSYLSNLASVGVCWNKRVDMKQYCFLLPRIAAEHILLNGFVEFEITFVPGSMFKICDYTGIWKCCSGKELYSVESSIR